MHLRLLPEKGKYKFRGVKMEMLVTKFSKGKYSLLGSFAVHEAFLDSYATILALSR